MVDSALKSFLLGARDKPSIKQNKNVDESSDCPEQSPKPGAVNLPEPVTPKKSRAVSPNKRGRSSPSNESEMPSPNPRPSKIADTKEESYPPGHAHVAASVATLTASYERLGGSQRTTEEIVAKLQLRFEAVLDEIKTAHEQSIIRANARYEALESEIEILKNSNADKNVEKGAIPPTLLEKYLLKSDHEIDIKIFLKKLMNSESQLKEYDLRYLKLEKKVKLLESLLESRETPSPQPKTAPQSSTSTSQIPKSQTSNVGKKNVNKSMGKGKNPINNCPKNTLPKTEAKKPEPVKKLDRENSSKNSVGNAPTGEKPLNDKIPVKEFSSPQGWTKPKVHPKTTDADGFTEVVGRRELKERKKAETVIPKLYPVHRRALLANFSKAIKDWKAQTTADQALSMVNCAMKMCPDVPSAPFLRARFSSNQSLVLTCGHEMAGEDYDAYLGVIGDSLRTLGTATVMVCEPWTRFVLNNVPVHLSPPEIRETVEEFYPSLKMCQTPYWLLPRQKIAQKEASSVVITIVGNLTVEKLGTDILWLHNRRCSITPHFGYGKQTQCQRCQRFGHHTKLCHAKEPTCGVCALQHLTQTHKCPIPQCKQGVLCVHPPIKCINCNEPHKATDKACPARAKAHLAARSNNKKSRRGKKQKFKSPKKANDEIPDSEKLPSTPTTSSETKCPQPKNAGETEKMDTNPDVAAVQEPIGEQPEIIDSHSDLSEEEL
jgi:hypothetical protein